jgi:predicted RNase H-like HicB family nuclease
MRRNRMTRVIKIEAEQEDDGRWLAEAAELPGVLAYGDTAEAAMKAAQILALRVLADRLEHDEDRKPLNSISFPISVV